MLIPVYLFYKPEQKQRAATMCLVLTAFEFGGLTYFDASRTSAPHFLSSRLRSAEEPYFTES